MQDGAEQGPAPSVQGAARCKRPAPRCMHHTVAGRPNVYSSTGNWKCALQFEIRCLQCVWMGWSPSRKLMNAIGKSFWKPRHIALSDQTGRATHVIAGTRARGRQLCWKPLTRASDHALKLPRPSQPAAPGSAVVSRIMTTGGCSARSAAKRRCLARN